MQRHGCPLENALQNEEPHTKRHPPRKWVVALAQKHHGPRKQCSRATPSTEWSTCLHHAHASVGENLEAKNYISLRPGWAINDTLGGTGPACAPQLVIEINSAWNAVSQEPRRKTGCGYRQRLLDNGVCSGPVHRNLADIEPMMEMNVPVLGGRVRQCCHALEDATNIGVPTLHHEHGHAHQMCDRLRVSTSGYKARFDSASDRVLVTGIFDKERGRVYTLGGNSNCYMFK